MIKNFTEFLNESNDTDMKISDIFSSLARNYEHGVKFFTDILQFKVEEEHKDWEEIRPLAELEKMKTEKAHYKLLFSIDEIQFLLELDFDITFKGKRERDSPEETTEYDLARLNTVLEDLKIKHIKIISKNVKYDTSSPVENIKKHCLNFMVKMMSPNYDTLGEKIYSLEQK